MNLSILGLLLHHAGNTNLYTVSFLCCLSPFFRRKKTFKYTNVDPTFPKGFKSHIQAMKRKGLFISPKTGTATALYNNL